jgi:uncharacterized membrane protein
MTKGRVEAFSDGVIAILITIMVLELKVPHGDTFEAIRPAMPVFLAYVLSFVYLGIYWNNHHHMLHATTRVTGGALWANLHLLFWLSLVPVVTHWLGEHHHSPLPTAAYGVVMFFSAIAYVFLQSILLRDAAHNPALARAIGSDTKGKISLALYLASIPLAFVATWISIGIYVMVALIWLIPDRRIERVLQEHHDRAGASH